MTDEYPSARAALFNSDKLVNFRCFLKYVLWHSAYALLAVCGIVFLSLAKILDVLFRSSNGRVSATAGRVITHPTTKKSARIIVAVGFVLYLAGFFAWLAYLFIQLLLANPIITIIGTILFICGSIGLLLAVAYGGPRVLSVLGATGDAVISGASKAGSKAKKTPGVRRVYGQCPVSLDQSPRWFDKILGK